MSAAVFEIDSTAHDSTGLVAGQYLSVHLVVTLGDRLQSVEGGTISGGARPRGGRTRISQDALDGFGQVGSGRRYHEHRG